MRKTIIALAGVAAITASACSSATTTPGASTKPSASASTVGQELFKSTYSSRVKAGKAGGQAIIADWQYPTTMNYYYAGGVTEVDVTQSFMNGFTLVTDDFKYIPDLVTTIPTVDNGGVKVPGDSGNAMTTTWTLRSGLKWSDGKDLTCDDVAYTWQWNMDPANTGLYGGTVGWEDIKSVDCPSATQVVIQWKNVYEGYLSLVAAVLPKHYLSAIPVADAATKSYPMTADIAKVPVSGPFKPVSVVENQEIRLERNPMYKTADGRAPYLDTLVFKFYADADTMIAGFKGNEVDIAKDLNEGDLPKVSDLGDQVQAMQAFDYELLRPNWASPVMKDPAMRQAVAYAINKDEINTKILGGAAVPANTNVSPNAWYYDATAKMPTFDLAKANSILDAAGWVKGSDDVRVKNGVRAEIKLCTTTRQSRQDTLALVASWLKQIGIKATVVPVKSTQIFATWNNATDTTECNLAHGTYDIAEHAFSSPLDPLGNYAQMHSSQMEPKGSNDARINDAQIDKVMDTLKTSVDFAKIGQAMKDYQQVYVSVIPEIPLYYRKNVTLHAARIGNFTGNGTNQGPLWNVADWYVIS